MRSTPAVNLPPSKQPALSSAELVDSQRAAQLFKVLADATRLQILYIIAHNTEREICAIDLSSALNVSAPTVTHHMKKLVDVNLVQRRKQGKWAYYAIVPKEFARVHALIASL
ncbi:MAG: metalloregulator ArsR/SmtB family transcription factor [Corynebacterium sp.]|uniref:Putative transcriptional regulator n=1 Tax=Corynebacterium mustelae TaxID=571915 RepID=A0A0G3GW16_9CORY|nr:MULTISPECIES: metalloregulator ArsR/SmtB family transcription factor [Corynebacterium]AKK04700.1 putative transcriptional regulator [Corynebacterium mustelae]MDO5098970.1 metalloregulator ArsR/SmtB family transcription factor [Corynebacterium sp.]